jgi:hypothetical protein
VLRRLSGSHSPVSRNGGCYGCCYELRDRGALDEEECFIDATFVMAKGGGRQGREGMRQAQWWITAGRLYQACRGLGVAKRCLELAVGYARSASPSARRR